MIKPVIIFRGMGIRMQQVEIDALNGMTGIRWYFQPKAWADTEFCLWWLEESFKADLAEAGIQDEVLLGLDGLKGQRCQSFLDKATDLNILPFYTPPDCTDVVAPCDHHVFVRLKHYIKLFYQETSERYRELWSADDNDELAASKKRVLVAGWVNDAWRLICDEEGSERFFRQSFTSTGFLMKLEEPGVEIKIKGLPDYRIYE